MNLHESRIIRSIFLIIYVFTCNSHKKKIQNYPNRYTHYLPLLHPLPQQVSAKPRRLIDHHRTPSLLRSPLRRHFLVPLYACHLTPSSSHPSSTSPPLSSPTTLSLSFLPSPDLVGLDEI
ncbi:hypothetical protein Syun_029976 [Stephania yunnanensis]|uniref:Uncharacterized protein n=1 Tax=Stephania yunnanensis TaxID=152371 RepID=A0AAP0HK23_9MAGN